MSNAESNPVPQITGLSPLESSDHLFAALNKVTKVQRVGKVSEQSNPPVHDARGAEGTAVGPVGGSRGVEVEGAACTGWAGRVGARSW